MSFFHHSFQINLTFNTCLEAAAKHIPFDLRNLRMSNVSSYSFILYPLLSSTEPLLLINNIKTH